MTDLASRWRALTETVAAPTPVAGEWWHQLLSAWDSPWRFYHTLDHLAAVLAVLDAPGEVRDPVALRLAAWFHDAVYDPRAADNEDRSAELARACARALGLSAARCEEVVRLILLTRTHRTAPDDVDGHALLDADLAILGAEPALYDRYANAIRQEYAWVPEAAYRQGRARVLQSFLDRPQVYQQPATRERLETPARANLQRELRQLAWAAGLPEIPPVS